VYVIITREQFFEAFKNYGREDNFSRDGLSALFDYLELLEEDTGDIELDVIALCCDFTEYKDIAEFNGEHGNNYNTIEDIEEETIVIKITDESFIIQNF
jgi:hypothetical protein